MEHEVVTESILVYSNYEVIQEIQPNHLNSILTLESPSFSTLSIEFSGRRYYLEDGKIIIGNPLSELNNFKCRLTLIISSLNKEMKVKINNKSNMTISGTSLDSVRNMILPFFQSLQSLSMLKRDPKIKNDFVLISNTLTNVKITPNVSPFSCRTFFNMIEKDLDLPLKLNSKIEKEIIEGFIKIEGDKYSSFPVLYWNEEDGWVTHIYHEDLFKRLGIKPYDKMIPTIRITGSASILLTVRYNDEKMRDDAYQIANLLNYIPREEDLVKHIKSSNPLNKAKYSHLV